jgi:putative transposase
MAYEMPLGGGIHRISSLKRRADVGGIFPNEPSIMRLIGAVLFEQNDAWQTSSRYMKVEALAQIDKEEITPILSITTKAA